MDEAADRAVLAWTNGVRAAAGEAPLRLHEALQRAARIKCEEVVVRREAEHASPRWGSPFHLQRACGARLRVMGAENLAFQRDLARAFLALLASPAHRANILHAEHRWLGVAVLPFPPSGIALCQEFGG